MNKQSERQKRYDDTHIRRYNLKFYNEIDRDIIERLQEVQSMQGYIKELIRKDINMDKGIRTVYTIINISIEDINKELEKPEADLEYKEVFRSESIGIISKELIAFFFLNS